MCVESKGTLGVLLLFFFSGSTHKILVLGLGEWSKVTGKTFFCAGICSL